MRAGKISVNANKKNNIKKLKGQTIDKIFEDYEVECAKYEYKENN